MVDNFKHWSIYDPIPEVSPQDIKSSQCPFAEVDDMCTYSRNGNSIWGQIFHK